MTVAPPVLANIPASLKTLPQWVCWRLEEVNGRKTKVPYAPKAGGKASSTDPATWSSFEDATTAFEHGGYAGVGFVFAANEIVGVDLDHCLKDGVLHPDAEHIVKTLNSFTEVSPSGDGLHVILLGKKPTASCAKPDMPWGGECAIYEKSRFFVVTGQVYGGYPGDLQRRQTELEAICTRLWPAKTAVKEQAGAQNPTSPSPPAQTMPSSFTDDAILDLAKKSKSAAKFEELWGGNWNGPLARCMSHSEADLKLCCYFAFYTKDAAQIDRLFRRSGLMREKWDEGRSGGTYGSVTIEKALARVTEQYRGNGAKSRKVASGVAAPGSDEASQLLARGRSFVDELRAAPDVAKLAAAIPEFLWRLPDIYLDELKPKLAEILNGAFKVSTFDRAIKAERGTRKQQGKADASAKHTEAAAGKPCLRNYNVFQGVDSEGNIKEFIRTISITDIGKTLLGHTGDWPRRVEALLFSDEGGTVRYLEARDDLFAWTMQRLPVFWTGGQDVDGQTLVSKAEFMSHLQATTTQYVAVENMPHEPVIAGHYYAWRPPTDYQPTGEYFRRLLDFFDNAESIDDLLLIKAALMTPAWGGLPGKRPAFVIMAPDRGCGKSTLANVIGHLYGGHIELNLTDTAEDKLTSRLLTPGAMTKRVVRIDNIKECYDSAFIEGLITAPTISGHRLYYGDANRPNTLTFVLTGNALRLSRDIAERSFIIRLSKPAYRADWESEIYNFVEKYRARILVDIIAALKQPFGPISVSDRYADWVKGVLARCGGNTDVVVRMNNERRGACDEDQDEAATIMSAVDVFVAEKHSEFLAAIRARACTGEDADTSDVQRDEWTFITATEMTEVVRKALNEPLTAKAVKSRLHGHIEAGRLPRVQWKKTRTANGYMVQRNGGGR